MKSTFKQIAAAVLTAAMCLSLAACGSEAPAAGDSANTTNPANSVSSAPAENTPAPEYVYTSEIKMLSSGKDWVSALGNTADGIYFQLQETVGQRELYEGETLEYEGQLDIFENRLGLITPAGETKILENYVPLKLDFSDFGEEFAGSYNYDNITKFAVAGDELIVVEDVYGYCFKNMPGIEMYSDEWYENFYNKEEFYIRHLDKTGAEISCARLDFGGDNGEYFYVDNAAFLDNGKALISCNQSLYFLDTDGQIINKSEVDNWIEGFIKLKDGRVCVTAYRRGLELFEVNLETGEIADTSIFSKAQYNMCDGAGDYDFYYTNGTNFYGYNLEEDKADKLFNWISCDVNYHQISNNVTVNPDGSFSAVINEYNNKTEKYDMSLINIVKKPASEVPKKETITFGAMYIGGELIDTIIDFNRKNSEVRIDIIDYSEYNTEDDYSAGLTKMTTEILSGQMPDILSLDGMPTSQLISKGLLENLYPYLDADPELGRESILPGVLAAMENNGGIYYASPYFYLRTLVGASSIVGDTPGWTYADLYEALEKMPEGCDVFDPSTTRDSILYSCLYQTLDKYIDWNTGNVYFDSPEFVELLKFANTFPADFDWENFDYNYEESTQSRIMQGKQMLIDAYIADFYDTCYYGMYFGGSDNVTFIGYPTADGKDYGSTMVLDSGMIAISAKSNYKQLAWQFVRQIFSEDYQKDYYGLPTNVNAFNEKLAKAQEIEYEKGINGEYLLDENGERKPVAKVSYWISEDNTYEIYNLNETESARFLDLVNNTSTLAGRDEELYNIVEQEVAAYFEGQKSAEEVAKLIQSKLTIYINEKR